MIGIKELRPILSKIESLLRWKRPQNLSPSKNRPLGGSLNQYRHSSRGDFCSRSPPDRSFKRSSLHPSSSHFSAPRNERQFCKHCQQPDPSAHFRKRGGGRDALLRNRGCSGCPHCDADLWDTESHPPPLSRRDARSCHRSPIPTTHRPSHPHLLRSFYTELV